jgi:hypothetical protein
VDHLGVLIVSDASLFHLITPLIAHIADRTVEVAQQLLFKIESLNML